MKSHELVPAPLIASIANLRHGGSAKILSTLLRDKLLSHDRSCGYDGYRLTTSGYDIMALENLKARGIVAALGDKIGTGKESDVYLAATADGKQVVLKFHRLGRTSFRDVKKKRLLQCKCCSLRTRTGWQLFTNNQTHGFS
jgi:RIO kinase 2